jgi:DNA-nicking Smr family endonuclease
VRAAVAWRRSTPKVTSKRSVESAALGAHKTGEPADINLFRAQLADAVPLKSNPRAAIPRSRPEPVPRQTRASEIAVLGELLDPFPDDETGLQTGGELHFLRDGVGSDVLRKLRRGQWVLQGELDLHGMTRVEARVAVSEFLSDALKRGWRCLRVIHGKGLGSKNREPVLKAQLGRWLSRRNEVLAFCQARRHDGGGGALVVLLKAGAKKPAPRSF